MRTVISAREQIEQEFGEPLYDILSGFFLQGESAASTAMILDVSASSVRDYSAAHGLQPPQRTKHPMDYHRRRARRRRGLIKYHGAEQEPFVWSAIAGVRPDTIRRRINLGWTVELAVETPTLSRDAVAVRAAQARWKKQQ